MMENESRTFLLRPVGGQTVPRGVEPTRTACVPAGHSEVRVVVHPAGCAVLVLRSDGQANSEEIVRREVAEALLLTYPDRVLTYHSVELDGDWIVRVYEGSLWGLVVGVYLGGDDRPSPPRGYTLGREVTDNPSFSMVELAALTEDEATAFVAQCLATAQVT